MLFLRKDHYRRMSLEPGIFLVGYVGHWRYLYELGSDNIRYKYRIFGIFMSELSVYIRDVAS